MSARRIMYVEEDRGFLTPCMIWQGGTTADGRYGRTRWNGRMAPAHRAFFESAGGIVGPGEEIDHLCGVTLCVNPTHLEQVDHVTNIRRSPATKLTLQQVEEIRAARDEALAAAPPTRRGTTRRRVPGGTDIRRRLAAQHGVTADQIKHIWGGRSWA